MVAKVLKTEMVQKISIVPRGQALGYVLKFPDEDRYLLTEQELMNKISALLAGRGAEQLVFNEVTTGAKDDLDKATSIARQMVCSYGMSSLGPMVVDEHYIKHNYEMLRVEIKKILDKGYKEALRILGENMDILHHISNTLMEKETINNEELDQIFKIFEKPMDCAT